MAPKPAVRAAILKAWDGGMTLSPARNACLVVRLAAADRKYGTVRFRHTETCDRRAGFNGVNVLKRGRDDHWTVVFEASDYACPVPRIPRAVQRDFKIC